MTRAGPRRAGALPGAVQRLGPVVDEVEAAAVRRIFREYADGRALRAIARGLNADGVPGRYRTSKGWSLSTLTRMLGNRKYEGVWIWNRNRNVRDPSTGACRQVPRPESEWHVRKDEALRIVDADLWTLVQARRKVVRRAWTGGRGRRGFSAVQRGGAEACPRYLLSGAVARVDPGAGRPAPAGSGVEDAEVGGVAAPAAGADPPRAGRSVVGPAVLPGAHGAGHAGTAGRVRVRGGLGRRCEIIALVDAAICYIGGTGPVEGESLRHPGASDSRNRPCATAAANAPGPVPQSTTGAIAALSVRETARYGRSRRCRRPRSRRRPVGPPSPG